MKKAFTMLELVFVIVVIGILAAVVIPRIGSNKLQEAAIQVVSHIRYTQHLALVDDRFDAGDPTWYRAHWQIYFKHDTDGSGDVVYTIYSNKDLDDMTVSVNPDADEIASSPLDRQNLTGDSLYANRTGSMNITDEYGIAIADMNTLMSNGCNQARRIFFDHLGRPLLQSNTSAYQTLLTSQCRITLTDGSDNIAIAIEPETGYACVLNSAGTDCI
ncbi:type II secretion system protein [Sulfurimonas crateris]|uniref:Type II secretion system protein n=1 Tax=Sulfurimonas crateris TaxID=2574727 RepID=A0A4U2Z496_9BACT|nr:type II secretion system protein [Sulfurimonas crateris]TKI68310.1 type II secretion system protein [Sulfurimonas crateris]